MDGEKGREIESGGGREEGERGRMERRRREKMLSICIKRSAARCMDIFNSKLNALNINNFLKIYVGKSLQN